jgi:2-oxoglutarate dehydrogenase E1 component
VAADVLHALAAVVRTVPEGFTIHPKLERQFAQRGELIANGQVDWALAEALAIGSLLQQGVNVRLTGQDTRRGTFSHRHAVLVDYSNADEFIPLAHIDDGLSRVDADSLKPPQGALGSFTVRDSLLSEYAAVGFEYGYSVEAPEALVAWEAQFGDFGNGAQIIIDNFLVAAEIKWGQYAGLVMLLPHGYEGQGPEHSSSRFERFLALCARGNLRVAIPTTSAQYFHLLRSQALRSPKRPLIVVTPKSMLRAHASRSAFSELETGSFAPVIDDDEVADPSVIQRIVLCSGKIVHEALTRRVELPPEEAAQVAVVRVEQLYPWPISLLTAVFDRYDQADEVVWLQEEPENMGAWSFVHARLHAGLPARLRLRHVSRNESASPAIGSAALHQLEQADLLRRAIG